MKIARKGIWKSGAAESILLINGHFESISFKKSSISAADITDFDSCSKLLILLQCFGKSNEVGNQILEKRSKLITMT